MNQRARAPRRRHARPDEGEAWTRRVTRRPPTSAVAVADGRGVCAPADRPERAPPARRRRRSDLAQSGHRTGDRHSRPESAPPRWSRGQPPIDGLVLQRYRGGPCRLLVLPSRDYKSGLPAGRAAPCRRLNRLRVYSAAGDHAISIDARRRPSGLARPAWPRRVLHVRGARESSRLPVPQRDGNRPELQQLPAGDTIVLHGRSGFGPEVVSLNPERALVLGGPPNEMGSQATWGFYLLEDPDGTTRLLKRGRGVYSATARAARSRRSSRTARPATKRCTRPTSMSSPAPASRRRKTTEFARSICPSGLALTLEPLGPG